MKITKKIIDFKVVQITTNPSPNDKEEFQKNGYELVAIDGYLNFEVRRK